MKRTASVDSDSLLAEPPSKRGSTLASYFTIQAPKGPNPIVSSDPLTDRRSTFVAHAAPVTTPTGAAQFQALVRTLVVEGKHPREADHEMYAARFMALRSGKDGTAPEDWTSKLAGDDDGEKGGSSAIKRCLESSGAVDVAVVVSRWYGGILLGQDRFKHITTVTNQALARLAEATELPNLIKKLRQADRAIDNLLEKPAAKPDYDKLDLAQAERLLVARTKRLEFLKKRKVEQEKEPDVEAEPAGPETLNDTGGANIGASSSDNAATEP